MKIHNIKSISDFEFEIPTKKGLYALTGTNASGKSTILSCAATSFYKPVLYSYFGAPYSDSKIEFEYNGRKRVVCSSGNRWYSPDGNLGITGFFEGSIVFGNRFKDIDFRLLKKLNNINKSQLISASAFIKKNLGEILHDDNEYYQKLYILEDSDNKYDLLRPTFYFETNGNLVNQLNMSTGENLLLTILYSLEMRMKKKNYGNSPMFILLDEIELALHSSALRRLVVFLGRLAEQENMVVIFSTHSIELIRSISPDNIYYLQRYQDNSLKLINPCYPVYATRNLESSNYGHDYIIMVEDNLAKQIVDNILSEKKLLNSKKVLVVAVGGWHQVLRFAYDTIRSNLMLRTTKLLIVLDRDIKDEVPDFLKKEKIDFSVKPNYLPIKSLEKYLLDNLVMKIDYDLFQDLSDYVFQGKPLSDIVSTYSTQVKNKKIENEEQIRNGKAFFNSLKHELEQIRKSEDDLTQRVVKYLFEKNNDNINQLTDFFEKELKSTK